ncbi:MAG TPA: class I SAM-dependent methyltransferase, partial [Verrucomicrobiae bacterium]|nr:class I SAM-dependent methyltransferase [Verrucomicrobiae bacterium]
SIADVGSGTGILTELCLKNGNVAFAVEPNEEMRAAADRLLAGYPGFRSIKGTAEATALPDQSVDLIVAGQAFHWFDRQRARSEFARILRPGGWVVLIWNDRRTSSTAFLRDYEELLQTCAVDYRAVDHKQVDAAAIGSFFEPGPLKRSVFENRQVFDFEGLKGRLLSSSYAPEPGHPKHTPMIEKLDLIFHKHQQNGRVVFEYDTLVYYGQLMIRAS